MRHGTRRGIQVPPPFIFGGTMKSVITVICYVTTDCNLDCRSCYTRAVYPQSQRMIPGLIKKLIENCSMGFDSVEFCWHGGEPLLGGITFYEAVITAQREITRCNPNVKFINTIQSNLLLLNEEFLAFLKTNGFRIGSSFDAPPDVHLKNRPLASGKTATLGTYLDRFEKIKVASLPLGLLCVVTKDNVMRGEEIFRFFRSVGASTYSLLPLIEVPRRGRPEPPSNKELFELYKTTFELWMKEGNCFSSIEPLDTMMKSLLGKRPQLCTFASSCLKRMISISPDGTVLPCGSLRSFPLGNIFHEPLLAILRNHRTRGLRRVREKSTSRYCRGCKYLSVCRGGCRELAFWHSGHYDGNFPYCEARKKTFSYLEQRLSEIISSQATVVL